MNERVRELAEQSGLEYNFDPMLWLKYEKFAELIVRECIAQCEKNKDHEWLGSGSKLSAFNIREHFGVEQ